MLKIFSFLICALLSSTGFGQNLVPDPSFEDTVKCPSAFSAWCPNPYDALADCVPPWFLPTCGSADYFHECVAGPMGVPWNFHSTNQPARTGSAYAGFLPNEYVGTPLLSPLQAGNTYYAECYVIIPCGSPIPPCNYLFSDAIGMHFSVGLPDTTGFSQLLQLWLTPQVDNPSGNLLNDTVNWMKISGTFVAAGGENYITIGNFYDSTAQVGTYYFVDDVLVIEDTAEGINEANSNYEITIYPNPATRVFTVQGATGEIQVFDLFGRKVLVTLESEIDMRGYAKGVYVLRIGEATRKIILQ